MTNKTFVGLALALCATLLLVSPTTAQEVTSGTIVGTVKDPAGKPIAGAVVITTSESGTRTAETDVNGNFIVPFLRPGTYVVRVEAPGGFNTVIQNNVSVGLGQRTNLNFTLEPGKTETVTVTAASPLVDMKATSTGTNIRYDEFANSVPLGRSFTDTYAVAAGVVSGLGTGKGNYSIGGASGLENAYLVDGVNITNTGYGGIGSYNTNYGSLGTGVTSDFLQEVQIKSGGFEAEYGQALGGIINTIVKSGTNQTRGTVAWYASPSSTQSNRVQTDLSSPAQTNIVQENVNDFAFSLGGPIVKDKLFYFVAYNPVYTTTSQQAQTGSVNPEAVAFNGGLATGGPFDELTATGFGSKDGLTYDTNAFPSSRGTLDQKRDNRNYAVKFSWQMTPKNTLELTAFGDPSNGDTGAQRPNATLFQDTNLGGGFSDIRYGANNQVLKWSAVFTPKFFMEAQVGQHAGYFRENSQLNQYYYRDRRNVQEFSRGANSYDPGTGPVPLSILPVTLRSGGIGYISDQDDKNLAYSVKLTNILGKHEIKYGVEYDDISYRDTSNNTGPSFTISLPDSTGALTIPVPTRGGAVVDVRNANNGTPTLAFDGANTFRVTRARMGPALPPTKSTVEEAFIQDTYSVLPRLTLKLGVRWSEEMIKGSGSFTLPFSPDPAGGFQATPSTYTPGEYTFAGNLAPRVGISWDVLGNGKSRLYANWGRYYERVPNDLAIRAFNNEVGVSFAQFSDRALTVQKTGPANPVLLQGVQPTSVAPGTKLPYEDEISGGYAFEMGPNSSFEVRAIFRTQGRVLEDTQVNAIEQLQNHYYGINAPYYYPYDPFGGSPSSPASTTYPAVPFGPYVLANPGTGNIPKGGIFPFPKAKRSYKALELIYTRRLTDNWSVYASYRFARLVGNYEGLFRNDNGQSDPNLTSLYDFPNSPLMAGQFLQGPLPADASHVLHVFPSYTFGNKLQIGGNFSWTSGVPRTSLLAHPIYQNSGEIPGIDPIYAYWNTSSTLTKTSSLSAALADVNAVSNPFLFSYTPVQRGNLGRTPDLVTLDLGVSYPFTFGKSSNMTMRLDVFNVLGLQEPLTYDDNIELTAGVPDPDFLKATTYQNPRTWRLSARWGF